ncbi:MAG: hypothetical protein NTX44_00285 [Ignavibacteriales bacterium]|nr:hypothetical protein [Ignavibacteriales bacterium]
MKLVKNIIFTMLAIFMITSSRTYATPSTIIWIPSVDFQGYKSFHLGIDNYAYDFNSGKPYSGTAFPTDFGLTVGVLPDSVVQAEIGFDYMTPQWSPFMLNAKVGVPEGALTGWSPAIAVGGFGFGFLKNVTDYNIFYGIVGKTFPVLGRIELGFFSGNKTLLVDLSTGSADNSGVLLSWDRQIPEISENLWLAVDYQGTKSSFGALSYGLAWTFSKNVSVIFARDVFNADLPSTFTMQLDINI